jgi:UDP-N-acetylglucosamine acyltransferase
MGAVAHAVDVASVLDRLCHRYPAGLVDGVTAFEPGRRILAIKNVSVNEDYFPGHFPGVPLMPGVLMIESLSQAATLLLLHDGDQVRNARTVLRGVSGTKFRRQVTPGDQIALEVEVTRRRGAVVRLFAVASVAGQVVTEAYLHMAVLDGAAVIHPSAIVHAGAVIGPGTVVGPYVTIGPKVRIGRHNRIGASCVIDGDTTIGDGNTLYSMGSFGQAPQDLKYAGEATRLVIGNGNVFREFVTIHRGTVTGRSQTTIGDRNYVMAYVHVAHDCLVGHDAILSHGTTLGGHVDVDDFATLGGYAGVHQFCRVGKYAFIGGFSACTKDVLPYSKTVGNRAMNYGLNSIGLVRRGFTAETVRKLKSAYRYLLVSKLNTARALERIEQDAAIDCPEVRYLVQFIRSAKRGVVLKRATRRTGESSSDD